MKVVIVGAGPGGLNCAYHLQQAGVDVTVLEKNEKVGPKVCAGGLTVKDMKYINPPEDVIDYKFNRLRIMLPGKDIYVSDKKPYLWTFSREKLGQWQASRLKKGTVRTGTRVTEIRKSHVVADGRKYRFDYLVGADGSASIVRRHLGLEFRLGTTIQYRIPTDKKWDITAALDYGMFSVWYLWIFPHKGYIYVGAGCEPGIASPSDMKKQLHQWLDEHGIDYRRAKLESFPITFNYLGHKFGNIFLVGDAAGLASALTGEGIYQAFLSGEDVARQIVDSSYIPVKINRLLKKKSQQNLVLWVWKHSRLFRPLIYQAAAIFAKSNWACRTLYRLACG